MKAALLGDCERVASEYDAAEVYAFVISCDFLSGDVTMALNTESAFQETVAANPDVTGPAMDGLYGLRHARKTFVHQPDLSAETKSVVAQYQRHQDEIRTDQTLKRHQGIFRELILSVLHESDLTPLNMSERFVAYVTPPDGPDVRLLEETIDKDIFARAFPDIAAFDQGLNAIAEADDDARATYWLRAAYDTALDRRTIMHKRLEALGQNMSTISDHLAASTASSGKILTALEELAFAAELTERGTAEYETLGRFTREGRLCTKLALTLSRVPLTDAEVDSVRDLLQRVFATKPEKGVIGTNVQVLARVLHTARPEQFPKADVRIMDNQLINWEAFGLTR